MKLRNLILLAVSVLIISSNNSFPQSMVENIDNLLKRYNEYRLFNGTALVAEKGEVLFSNGYGMANMEWNIPNKPDTKFRIGSISKQFTATIIMQLVEEGKIKLDGKITDYLPDYRKDTGDKITIHQLLNHTSGILSYTSIPGVWSDSSKLHYDQDYFVKNFHSSDLQFEPGKEYSYNNTGYYLLAVIAERVTGQKFGMLLQDRILKPLGMTDTGSEDEEIIIPEKAYGYIKLGGSYRLDPYFYMPNALGAGHMYSTVEDMVKWDQALYSDKILSEESKEKMFTPYLNNYGYGWVIVKDTIAGTNIVNSLILHGGGINGFNTIFVRIVNKNQMIALFNNTGNAPLNQITGEIIKILNNQDFNYPKKPVSELVAEIIERDGIKAAIDEYRDVKANKKEEYDFSENLLNSLGYAYLSTDDMDKALAVFKLNIEAYPDGFNTYDSYAEALMKKGDKEGAIEYYKKSLELNPGNTNGINQLKKLGVDYQEKEVTIENNLLMKYAGKYQLFPEFVITIRVDNDKIFARATGQDEFEIFPQSETKFYYKVVNAQIEFIADEDGNFNKMILYQNNREMPAERIK